MKPTFDPPGPFHEQCGLPFLSPTAVFASTLMQVPQASPSVVVLCRLELLVSNYSPTSQEWSVKSVPLAHQPEERFEPCAMLVLADDHRPRELPSKLILIFYALLESSSCRLVSYRIDNNGRINALSSFLELPGLPLAVSDQLDSGELDGNVAGIISKDAAGKCTLTVLHRTRAQFKKTVRALTTVPPILAACAEDMLAESLMTRIHHLSDSHAHLIATASRDGILLLRRISGDTSDRFTAYLDGPIHDVLFYQCHAHDPVHLLAISAAGYAALFPTVATTGLDHLLVLPESNAHQGVTCIAPFVRSADRCDVVIGCYDGTILLYEIQPDPEGPFPVAATMIASHKCTQPVYNLFSADITADGSSELVAIQQSFLAILACNLPTVES